MWRLRAADGASSSFVDVPGVDDPLWAPNMSVWETRDALTHFMYKSGHASYLRRRAEWFQRPDGLINVLWWSPAGEIPTLEDAVRRLRHLEQHGPSEHGFGFRDDVSRRLTREGQPKPLTRTAKCFDVASWRLPMTAWYSPES